MPADFMACSFFITGSCMINRMYEMLAMPNNKVKRSKQSPVPNKRVRHKKQKTINNVWMTTLQERINELFADHSDKKPVDLARYAKVSRSAVSDWMGGKTKTISGANALAVAKFFGANFEWVQTGKGKKYPKWGIQNTNEGPDTRGEVPLISFVKAGEWCEVVDNYAPGDGESWWPCPERHGPHAYALRVEGDSMTSPYPGQKSYPEGTIIYVDPDVPIVSGSRVVAKLPSTDKATFKEYRYEDGKHLLKPINPQYQIIEINEETHFCGVVIGKFEPE